MFLFSIPGAFIVIIVGMLLKLGLLTLLYNICKKLRYLLHRVLMWILRHGTNRDTCMQDKEVTEKSHTKAKKVPAKFDICYQRLENNQTFDGINNEPYEKYNATKDNKNIIISQQNVNFYFVESTSSRSRHTAELRGNVDLSNQSRNTNNTKLGIIEYNSARRRQSFLMKCIRYAVGDVSEFVSIFGPKAHYMLMHMYEDFGPVYTFSAFGQRMVFLFEVEDVDKLKSAEGRCPRHIDFKHLKKHREEKGYPQGLLVSNGEEWYRQRKILSNPLMLKISHHVEVLDELVLETISQIWTDYTVNGSGTFRVESITIDFSINAFGTLLYGYTFDNTFKENGNIWKQFAAMAKENFDDAKKLLITPKWMMKLHPAWQRHNTRWNFLLKTTMDMIERCTKDMEDDCILASLLHGRKLNDKEIFINLTDLLVASIDTTNTTLQWCLYELACNPDVQVEILTEADNVLGGRLQVEKADLDKLVYLKAVLWEALRLHPVGFFTSRIIVEEMNVGGLKIPPETHVAISMYVMGRNKVLFPHPDCFRPERWLTNCNKIKKFPRDVFFGFGPRMCLGRKIAEMEIMLFLLRFCMKFEFSTKDKQIDQIVKLFLSPSRPVELDTKRRTVDS